MSEDYISKSIAMANGKMGVVVRQHSDKGLWGIQVPGEEDICWLSTEEIKDLGGGALIQIPNSTPTATMH